MAEGEVRELPRERRIRCTITGSELLEPHIELEGDVQEFPLFLTAKVMNYVCSLFPLILTSTTASCRKMRPSIPQPQRTRFCQQRERTWKWFFPESPNKSPADQLLELDLVRPGAEKPVKPKQTSNLQNLQKILYTPCFNFHNVYNLLWQQQKMNMKTL